MKKPRLSYLLRVLHREYTLSVEAALAEAGFDDLRPGDAKVFPFVPAEGIQVGELAARAGVRKQTMAQSVDQLEACGYLQRRSNPQDGRSRLIFLTARGAAARPAAANAGDHIEQQWAQLTSPEELEQLRDLLHRLLKRLGETDPAAAERLAAI
jgi:DNA-binding MarR family transcriptional regulator